MKSRLKSFNLIVLNLFIFSVSGYSFAEIVFPTFEIISIEKANKAYKNAYTSNKIKFQKMTSEYNVPDYPDNLMSKSRKNSCIGIGTNPKAAIRHEGINKWLWNIENRFITNYKNEGTNNKGHIGGKISDLTITEYSYLNDRISREHFKEYEIATECLFENVLNYDYLDSNPYKNSNLILTSYSANNLTAVWGIYTKQNRNYYFSISMNGLNYRHQDILFFTELVKNFLCLPRLFIKD